MAGVCTPPDERQLYIPPDDDLISRSDVSRLSLNDDLISRSDVSRLSLIDD